MSYSTFPSNPQSTGMLTPGPSRGATPSVAPPRGPPPMFPQSQNRTPAQQPIPVHSSAVIQQSASGMGAGPGRRKQGSQSFKGVFMKELKTMMFAFGDDPNPAPDTLAVMEEIVIEYILDLCQTALRPTPHKNRLQVDDLRRALSRPADAKELGRLEELIYVNDEITRVRKEFATDDT